MTESVTERLDHAVTVGARPSSKVAGAVYKAAARGVGDIVTMNGAVRRDWHARLAILLP